MGKRSIVHVVIPAKDRSVSAKFYYELFAWDNTDLPAIQYTAFETGNLQGGFQQSTPEQPGVVAFYVQSEDIETDLRKVEQLGGKTVVPKMDIPGMGSIAFFTDLSGNIIGLATFPVQA